MTDPPREVPPDAPTEGVDDSIAPGSLVAGRFRLATPVARSPDAWIVNGLDERSRRRVRLRFSSTEPSATRLALRHPALPAVLGHGSEAPGRSAARHWVALDWFDGRPLPLDTPPGDAPRTRRRTVVVGILSVLDALEHLHEAAGPHGALSRASIWLGEDGRLRIVDATAPPVDPAGGATWATPEGLRDLVRTERTDVYAVGSLLVGWLSGRAPFGTDPAGARAGHLVRPLPDLVPPEPPLREVIARAMQKQPEDRFPSAAAFREALAAALRDVEPVAVPLTGAATVPVGTPADALAPDLPPRMPIAPPPSLDDPFEPSERVAELTSPRLAIAGTLVMLGALGLVLAWFLSMVGLAAVLP